MVRKTPHPRFRFVDLFAGIGGFHLAMSALGGECVFASEIDPKCRDVYEWNFKQTPKGDIRPFTEGPEVLVPEHDVLCAGFPCQPFSKSGHQRGINEARGTLFFNILKILEARRPRFVILENVRNLAGPRQRETWDTIIRNLRRLGYRVADEPVVFSPHLLPRRRGGAPQIRERVFILGELAAHTASPDLECLPLVTNRAVGRWDPKLWCIDDYLMPDDEIDAPEQYALREQECLWIDAWNDFIQVVDEPSLPGFPIWADAFRVQPQIDEDTPAWKANFLRKNSALYLRNRKAIDQWRKRWPLDTFPPSRRKLEWQARDCPRDLWQLVMHLRPSGIRVKPPTYLPALVAITQTSIIGARRRRITPREAARLQSFPERFKLHHVDSVAYKQLGNAVNVGAVKHVARALFNGALDAQAETPKPKARQARLKLKTKT